MPSYWAGHKLASKLSFRAARCFPAGPSFDLAQRVVISLALQHTHELY